MANVDPAAIVGLASVILPVAVGVGAPTIAALRKRRRRKRLERWLAAAGLSCDATGRWQGSLGEQRVELAVDANDRLVVSVLIRPALDLGLVVQPPHWPSPLGREKATLPDVAFEGELWAYGTRAYRVRELLDVGLRESLCALGRRRLDMRLLDDRVQLWLQGNETTEEAVREAVGSTAGVIADIERQRGALPAARELAPYLQSWIDFAEEHGLELSRAPLGLRGALRGRDVWAVAVRSEDRRFDHVDHLLDVLVWFEPPLGLSLSVRTRRPSDTGAERPPSAAEPFDRLFEIEAPSAAIDSVLGRSIQQQLTRLQRPRGSVELTDGWLWVRLPQLPVHPSQALEVMDEVAELAHVVALAARRVRSTGAGPYRSRQ